MTIQDEIFKESEGDNFYCRRLEKGVSDKERFKNDLVLNLIEKNKLSPKKVAEVGACNGYRLALISRKYEAECVAFEPSRQAIKDGAEKFPEVKFHQNVASDLESSDGYFDLVIVYFVLCWIDRKTLFRSLAEIDRILCNGGYLILGDFLVTQPQRRRYHYLEKEKVWTYKQDYWKIFSESIIYSLIEIKSIEDAKVGQSSDNLTRFCALLKKNLNKLYPIVNK